MKSFDLINHSNPLFWPIAVPVICLAIVLTTVGMWFVSKKTGLSGWKGVVPFYNLFVFAEIGKKSNVIPATSIVYMLCIPAFFAYLYTPLLGYILKEIGSETWSGGLNLLVGFFIAAAISLGVLFILCAVFFLPLLILFFNLFRAVALSFGKGSGFALGLLLLPYIFWPILGFDSSVYLSGSDHEVPVPQGGALAPNQAVQV